MTPTTNNDQGGGRVATPVNSQPVQAFAILRGGYIQSDCTDLPMLFQNERDAKAEMMAPLESHAYPMTILPTASHDRLESENRALLAAHSADKERIEKLEKALNYVEAMLRGKNHTVIDRAILARISPLLTPPQH